MNGEFQKQQNNEANQNMVISYLSKYLAKHPPYVQKKEFSIKLKITYCNLSIYYIKIKNIQFHHFIFAFV